MSVAAAAEESLKNGDPAAALLLLQEQVRAKPADRALRVFLFQLLCVRGEWERALNQLKVASDLDAGALAMAQMYGEAVRCEAIRRDVFDGKKAPMVFGEPEQWLALLIESLLVAGRGEMERPQNFVPAPLRRRPPRPAKSTGSRSSGWLMPTRGSARCSKRSSTGATTGCPSRDWRASRSRRQRICATWSGCRPTCSSRTVVRWSALVPTRYPGSESSEDGLIALARKTVWQEVSPGTSPRPRPARHRHRRDATCR